MMQLLANFTLRAVSVMPAIEMIKDFSETAEVEAKVAAQSLLGLGAFGATSASFTLSAICLMCLSHFIVGGIFLTCVFPMAYGAYLCKKRLDVTREKLEQLKMASLASRAAKSIGSKAVEMVSAAGSAVANLADDASSLPNISSKAISNSTSTVVEAATAAAQVLSDPAHRKAAVDLAGEAFHGLARGAGMAAGWLKAQKSANKNSSE